MTHYSGSAANLVYPAGPATGKIPYRLHTAWECHCQASNFSDLGNDDPLLNPNGVCGGFRRYDSGLEVEIAHKQHLSK